MPRIIPAYRDGDGFWWQARSTCCHAPIMRFDADVNLYVVWNGFANDLSAEETRLVCRRCNRELTGFRIQRLRK